MIHIKSGFFQLIQIKNVFFLGQYFSANGTKTKIWWFGVSRCIWSVLVSGWKKLVFGVFLVRVFPYSEWILRDMKYFTVFSPDAGKYRPEKLRIGTLFMQCENIVFIWQYDIPPLCLLYAVWVYQDQISYFYSNHTLYSYII